MSAEQRQKFLNIFAEYDRTVETYTTMSALHTLGVSLQRRLGMGGIEFQWEAEAKTKGSMLKGEGRKKGARVWAGEG